MMRVTEQLDPGPCPLGRNSTTPRPVRRLAMSPLSLRTAARQSSLGHLVVRLGNRRSSQSTSLTPTIHVPGNTSFTVASFMKRCGA